jgi:hypothetical protein
VKNTTYNIESSLNQMSVILEKINSMRTPVLLQSAATANLPEPLAVVFFGDSSDCKLSDIQGWYAKHKSSEAPAYTVLLDRGVIIAFENFGEKMFEYDEPTPLGLKDHRNRGDAYLCTPQIRDDSFQGRALLWLYLAIADHLSTASAQRGHIRAFTETAASTYALGKLVPLSSVPDWDAYDKAVKA